MFRRLLWQMLRGSRGRLAVALVALISGAAVISGLLNLDLDVNRQLTQEFNRLGANLVVSPRNDAGASSALGSVAVLPGFPVLMNESAVMSAIQRTRAPELLGAAPFLYVIARAAGTPVVVAGTWLDEARKITPTWKLEGDWVTSREDETRCLVGRNVAARFHLAPGGNIDLNYGGHGAHLTVAGIVEAGDTDDNQVFVNLPVAQNLAVLPGQAELAQLSVSGSAAGISAYAGRLAAALPAYDVRSIRQVTEGEGALLGKIRLLIVSMAVLILVLTALCVLATMAALAMERRQDVGLMKALGGSISRIVGLFLAEVGALGAAGGLIGCVAGIALSHWMGERVFHTSISMRWEVFPLTVVLTTGVSLLAALPLRLLGAVKPAVILRGE